MPRQADSIPDLVVSAWLEAGHLSLELVHGPALTNMYHL
jgi:hypothetical protein